MPVSRVRQRQSPFGSITPEGAEQRTSTGWQLSTVTIQMLLARARMRRVAAVKLPIHIRPLGAAATAVDRVEDDLARPDPASWCVRCVSGMGVQVGLAHRSLQIRPAIELIGKLKRVLNGRIAKWVSSPAGSQRSGSRSAGSCYGSRDKSHRPRVKAQLIVGLAVCRFDEAGTQCQPDTRASRCRRHLLQRFSDIREASNSCVYPRERAFWRQQDVGVFQNSAQRMASSR